jgi:hypothetical protein
MRSGAYVTNVTNLNGRIVECIDSGGAGGHPTTLNLNNPNIVELNATNCANVTTNGGAIQAGYNSGVTTVAYIAPGVTNLLGFYPTTTALWAATGGTPAGMYVAYGSSFSSMQNLKSNGTDWEVLAGLPSTCSISGSSWAYGTYNDGTHGCLPIVWALDIGSSVAGCAFDTPAFSGLYLYQPTANACDVKGYATGGVTENVSNATNIISGPVSIINGNGLTLYSDYGSASVGGITGAGAGILKTLTVQPGSDGFAFNVTSSGGTNYFNVNTSTASANLFNSVQLSGYSDTGSTQTFSLATATGLLKLYNGGGASITLTGANGLISAAGLYQTPVGQSGTPAAGSFSTLSANSTVSGSGFSTYLASPPAIGGTSPNSGTFTHLTAGAGAGVITTPSTVSGLDSTPAAGERAFITDDNSACTFGTIATGGGSTKCPVVYNGTNWVAG